MCSRAGRESLHRRSPSAIRATVTVGLAMLAAAIVPAAGSAAPIPSTGPAPSLPPFQGAAAEADKLKHVTKPPQNPFMAEDPNNNIHNDTWMTDQYLRRGPLGRSPVATSEA